MIKDWLKRTGELQFTIYALTAAFGVYFCMYAYRKPFTAATFDNKELLVIAQVIGYLISKFYGIKFISELSGQKRAYLVAYLIGFAHLMLLAFAYIPYALRSYDFVLLFLNGLPLGVIWGIVFSYLEGRKFTEVLAAGLTVSFIISSGFVKSVGKALMTDYGIGAYTMPFASGVIFLPFLLLFVWMLAQIPPPNPEDIALRAKRTPMTAASRKQFFHVFAPGLLLLIVSYMLFTAYRDIRETFANEIWTELGISDPAIFTRTELPVGIVIGVVMAVCFRIKDNVKAFKFYHWLVIVGLGLILSATLAFSAGVINSTAWMVLIGIGAYMAYVTFASVMFDRLMGAYRESRGNAGFMIYVVDAAGYLGSVLIMGYKLGAQPNLNWYEFFLTGSYLVSTIGIAMMCISLLYFSGKLNPKAKLAAAA